ncbi:dienelactone hydrolase family protein [Tsuneonella sp. YG55]|uniref:Dienelactone hydrolase family protein n=1 Tax=Tsuneonella litorea TaxID=2976475 RepID=A0A9X3AMB4_9SPHN|nr:dienelactone hydrolase family protein [Tsuneonella litorea]MCT2558182.1 dienelactone hydrolase family protein [Tsuneonella litorea]
MTLEPVAYRDGPVDLSGMLYRPVGKPRAAVAVFPTILNPTPAVEAKARALAEAGYVALIADFYGQSPADFPAAVALSTDLRADPARYRKRLAAALDALSRAAPGLRQAAIGFCMGGQAVVELAREGADLVAVASFHGLLDTGAPAEPGTVKARILVCHGDADPLVPREQVVAFWEEMDRAGANWHFHAYSGVVHGFTNPNRPPAGGPVAYDASADRQSWAAMLSLFDEVFG